MPEDERLGLDNLPAPFGAKTAPKRKGRGPGSGLGKTAGRGQNGQRSRAGGRVRRGFEGGQMPLIRRLPKRGFHNPFRKVVQVVNLRDLDKLSGAEITPDSLADGGLVAKKDRAIKILALGDASRAYVVKGCAVSKGARGKIEQAGGRIEE